MQAWIPYKSVAQLRICHQLHIPNLQAARMTAQQLVRQVPSLLQPHKMSPLLSHMSQLAPGST